MAKSKGWSASFGDDWRGAYDAYYCRHSPGVIYGETDIRQLNPLGTNAPGTVIWQSATGTNPNRFYPLRLFESLGDGACPPNTTTITPGQTMFGPGFGGAISRDQLSLLQCIAGRCG